MSTTIAGPAGKALAKKPSAKRQAAKKTVALSADTLMEQIVALRHRIASILTPAYGQNFSMAFAEQYDHDLEQTTPAFVIRYTLGADTPLSSQQLSARRQMLSAWNAKDYAITRQVFTLDEQFA